MKDLRSLLLIGLSAIVLTACTGAGTAPPSASNPPAAEVPPTGGGSSGSDPGTGIGSPAKPPATDPGSSGRPGDGLVPPDEHPTIVVPKPGRLDVHDVGAIRVGASVDGGHVIARLTWWSGVEPCSVLDSVAVVRNGSQIRLTIREGADRRDVACIEIAMLKATIVDLGVLPAGSYTITANGDAPPVQVVVG